MLMLKYLWLMIKRIFRITTQKDNEAVSVQLSISKLCALPNEIKLYIFSYLQLEVQIELIFGIKAQEQHCYISKVTALFLVAVRNGNLSLIKWLVLNRHVWNWNSIDYAAEHGQLEIVKYLNDVKPYECTTDAMDKAAQNGYLDVVKWLHFNRIEGCTRWAIDFAAQECHIDVVKWLHLHRREGCSSNALYLLPGRPETKHLEITNYIEDNDMMFVCSDDESDIEDCDEYEEDLNDV
jgi:hypothetical protein